MAWQECAPLKNYSVPRLNESRTTRYRWLYGASLVLILVGGTGTGKSHLATALSIAAIHLGKRVRFYNAVDLVNQLDKEK